MLDDILEVLHLISHDSLLLRKKFIFLTFNPPYLNIIKLVSVLVFILA